MFELGASDIDLVVGDGFSRQQVDLRRADKLGDEQIGGRLKEGPWVGSLLYAPLIQNDDAIRHRHRFDLIVCDIEGSPSDCLVEGDQLGPHGIAQFCVEVGQRLVHQVGGRLADYRARERHALPLAAGKLVGIFLEPRVRLRRALRLRGPSCPWWPGPSEPSSLSSRGRRCSRRRSYEGRARSSGTPWPRRDPWRLV